MQMQSKSEKKSAIKQTFRGFKVFFDILKIERLNYITKLLLSLLYTMKLRNKALKFSDKYLASIFKVTSIYINECLKSLEKKGYIKRITGKPYRKKVVVVLNDRKAVINKWKIDREIILTEEFCEWMKGNKNNFFLISSSILKTSYSPIQKIILAWLVSLHQSRNRPKDKRYNTRRGAIDNSPPYDYLQIMRLFGLSRRGAENVIAVLRHKHDDSGKSVENCRNGIMLHRRYGSHGNKLISTMNKRYFYDLKKVEKPVKAEKEEIELKNEPIQERKASGSFDKFEGETIESVPEFIELEGKQYNEKGEQIGKSGMVFDEWVKTVKVI